MAKMYSTCPRCGAHLDYGERCDCGALCDAEAEKLRTGRKITFNEGINMLKKAAGMEIEGRKI